MDLKTKRLRWGLLVAIAIASIWAGAGNFRRWWRGWNQDPSEQAVVLVADHYLSAFTMVRAKDLREMEYPKALVPPGSIASSQTLANESGQLLFMTAVAIPEGHPVTRALLVDASRSEALGSLIGPGKVAVSFEVDRAHGVGGWVKPGDVVAVFGSSPKPRLLFPSMLVLAVETERLGEQKDKKSEGMLDPIASAEALSPTGTQVITVLAPAREATGLVEARESGTLSVVLRSPGDELPWPAEK